MEMIKTNGFCELSLEEMQQVDGGLFSFVADIYDTWCKMWKDFGKSIYYMTH